MEIRRAAEAYLYSLFWGRGESLKSPRSSPASRRAARMIVQRSLKMTNEKSQYGLDDVLWTYALDGMPKVSMSLHLSYPFLPFVSPPSSSAAASDLCVTVQKWRFFPFPPKLDEPSLLPLSILQHTTPKPTRPHTTSSNNGLHHFLLRRLRRRPQGDQGPGALRHPPLATSRAFFSQKFTLSTIELGILPLSLVVEPRNIREYRS